MKKILFLLIVSLTILGESKATHIVGGEIGWDCLANGKFRFYMVVYRDCTGVQFRYENETLFIDGSTYPKTVTGSQITSIVLKPDSNRWLNERSGDTSPECTNQYGAPNTCLDRDQGSMQQFFYLSDPITLDGRPPKTGWNFYWDSPCCRPGNIANVNTNGSMRLRAAMFRTKNADNVNPCIDSSPKFKALPTTQVCRGIEFTYNSTVIDPDLDSTVFGWDRPYNPPIVAGDPPIALEYKSGYTPKNPTPDKAQDVNNIPSTLSKITGQIKMAVYSGGGTQKYLTVHRVDAYRDGVKIATVYREIPVSVYSCPKLPNGKTNYPPAVKIDGEDADGVIKEVTAGQQLRVGLQIKDNDLTGVGSQLQTITLVPGGLMFSKNKSGPTPCQVTRGAGKTLVVEPCAYLQNKSPIGLGDAAQIQGLGSITTKFIWQTDCRHIQTKTGVPGTLEGIYRFVLRVSDDHCPTPGLNYPTITVKVKDPIPLEDPIMKGVSIDLQGKATYQWAPPIDSATTFDHYKVEQTFVNDGGTPSIYSSLNNNLRLYESKKKNEDYFLHVPLPGGGNNILRKLPNRDWYFRMISASGCTDSVLSVPSQPARVIEPELTAAGASPRPARSKAKITWNRPKPQNARTHPYHYESKTHFYVWENDSISNGGAAIASNWYLRGDTVDATEYTIPTNVCGDYVGIRIEARDTVIIPRQGSVGTDSLQKLVFSTFSVIDTFFMEDDGFIPKPKFDTIQVMANGDIYVRVDRGNAGTAGTFNVYQNSQTGTLLSSMKVSRQDSALIAGQGANTAVKSMVLESVDICKASNVSASGVYTTILPTGALTIPACSAIYRLNWNRPTGFPNGVSGYRIYSDSTNSGFSQIATITNPNTTTLDVNILRNKTVYFQIVAFDNEGAVNISAIHRYITPKDLRTFEVVPSPELRCTYVNADGSVQLSFIPPLDSTGNGLDYEIDYRLNGGNWVNYIDRPSTDTLFPGGQIGQLGLGYNGGIGVNQLDSFTIMGINAHDGQYDIRMRTRSGCDGRGFSPYNVISTIDVSATAKVNDIFKRADIRWNPTGVDYGVGANPPLSTYTVFKDTFDRRYDKTNINIIGIQLTDEESEDNTNSQICDDNFNYYVEIQDPLAGCLTRSNIDSARIRDNVRPEPQPLKYITYTHLSRGVGNVNVYWNNEAGTNPGDVDWLIFQTTNGFNSGLLQYLALDSTEWTTMFGQYTIDQSLLDASDSSVVLGAQSKDPCDTKSLLSQVDFHRTIDVDVEWNTCDSTFELSWNPYVGFDANFDVEYDLWVDINNDGDFVQDSLTDLVGITTTDTTATYKVTDGGREYAFQVHARSLKPSDLSFVSNSNVAYDSAIFEQVPRYGYKQYVTVLPTNEIGLRFYKDTLIDVSGYIVKKGVSPFDLRPIEYVDYAPIQSNTNFDYTDIDVNVDETSYYYNIVTQSTCGVPVDTSNTSRSVHLSVEANSEAITNELTWNGYEGWDSTVAFYNIYRGVDGQPSDQVYAVAAPSSNGINTYIDDVYDDASSQGNFCYRVEAVQGPIGYVTEGFPNNLQPASSMSNMACANLQPLFYVPNAFAPDGINQTFGPKGQFFDFTRFEMAIYNRWGEELYRTRDINKGWDGTFNGELVQVGSYVYMIRFVDASGKEHRRKGTVTLIR